MWVTDRPQWGRIEYVTSGFFAPFPERGIKGDFWRGVKQQLKRPGWRCG